MATLLDSDVHRAASYRNMVEHLTAPLRAGAVDTLLAIDAAGKIEVDWKARLPLLLLAPLAPLEETGLRLTVTPPDGEAFELDFAPYTEDGAHLPAFRPSVDADGFADQFSVKLGSLRKVAEDGTETAVPVAEIADRIGARILEGNLGCILYLMAAEKQRLRRQARQLAAMRRLDRARDNALDRMGADVGVPRFSDTLAFRAGEIVTDTRREPDADYRRRLQLYRPWLLPTKNRIMDLLNGPGEPATPNAGALGELGLAERFALAEDDNEFAVAIAMVGVDDPAYRDGFFEFIRATQLIWPRDDAASDAVHASRFIPASIRDRDQRLRENLRQSFSFVSAGADLALAPMLTAALARAGACRRALGATTKWKLLRGQRPDDGSRYELGLGADLDPLSAQELNSLAAAHAARSPNADPELEALLASMTPRSAADDPDGAWLVQPCGLRTVHRVDAQTLYVSHLPIYGLEIIGPQLLQPTGWTTIVRGHFTENGFDDVLFYERASGLADLRRGSRRADLPLFAQLAGLRTTWSVIVAADITPGPFDDLLFYERSTGSAELHSTDGNGTLTLVRSYTGLRKRWSSIVAGRFRPDSAEPGLFFYDRSTGEGELHSIDETGKLTLLAKQTGLRKTWTHVLAGTFTDGPLTDLLFYERTSGTVEIYSTDGSGRLRLVRRTAEWRPGLTHLVAGGFVSERYTDVLGYARDTGETELYETDGVGNLLAAGSFVLRPGWTQVVPANLGGGPLGATGVLFYDRDAGSAEIQAIRGRSGFFLVRALSGLPKSSEAQYEAHYRASGDPATNVVLVTGLAEADTAWRGTPLNGPAWAVITTPEAQSAWQAAVAPSAGALEVFRAAGLPAVSDPARVAEQLRKLPPELIETIRLDAAQAARILAGTNAAAAELRNLVGVVRASGIASALPLVTVAGEVVLVLGAIGLPQAGINLSDRRSSGFRWYLVPIQGIGGDLSAVGSRTLFAPVDAGVYALVVVGYARTDKTDPYEYRVELPENARLTPLQYEFLMNVLDQTFPVGVEVNTYAIRHDHVDLDGDGTAEPLTPAVSKTYRAFRRPRHRGQVAVTLDEP